MELPARDRKRQGLYSHRRAAKRVRRRFIFAGQVLWKHHSQVQAQASTAAYPKANAVNPQSIAEVDAFGPLSSRARFPRCQPCLYMEPTSRYPDCLHKGERCVDCGIAFEEDPHSRKFSKLF